MQLSHSFFAKIVFGSIPLTAFLSACMLRPSHATSKLPLLLAHLDSQRKKSTNTHTLLLIREVYVPVCVVRVCVEDWRQQISQRHKVNKYDFLPCVVPEEFIFPLVSSVHNVSCIDNNHIITHVNCGEQNTISALDSMLSHEYLLGGRSASFCLAIVERPLSPTSRLLAHERLSSTTTGMGSNALINQYRRRQEQRGHPNPIRPIRLSINSVVTYLAQLAIYSHG